MEVGAADNDVFSNISEDQAVATTSKYGLNILFCNITKLIFYITRLPFELEAEVLPENIAYLEDYNRPPDTSCQILDLFLREEKQLKRATGAKVQLMDPILRKAYSNLPPLP